VLLRDGLLHGCSPHERVNVNAVQVCHIKAEVVRVCSQRRRGGCRCNGGQRHGDIRAGVAEVEVMCKLRVRAGLRC
jgi:hypothetical protein